MHHAIRSAALAIATLLGATGAEAEPGKAPAAAERGHEGHDKGQSEGAHGKSAEAHAAAPGKSDEARPKKSGDERGEAKSDEHSGKEKPPPGAQGEKREQRRKHHQEALKGQYGVELLQRPPVAAELKTHAWRVARFERMRTLAEAITDANKRKQTLERLDKLIAKEQARHDRQMDALRTQNANTAPGESPGAGKPAEPGRGTEKHADEPGGHP